MNDNERKARFDALRHMGCIACNLDGLAGCGPPEIHHLNLGGRAGQKRIGDEATICLGAYHHRGVLLPGKTIRDVNWTYGPSLARASRMFREQYGNDTQLLERTNQWLRKQA